MALIDKVRVIKLLLFALFMMVSMVTPAQSQVDWSIKAGIGMANIIGDNMGSPKVKLAYKLGIGLECPFDKIWSLQTGVSFVSKGTNHTIVETDGISAQAKVRHWCAGAGGKLSGRSCTKNAKCAGYAFTGCTQ